LSFLGFFSVLLGHFLIFNENDDFDDYCYAPMTLWFFGGLILAYHVKMLLIIILKIKGIRFLRWKISCKIKKFNTFRNVVGSLS